jgi:hypothetical protein
LGRELAHALVDGRCDLSPLLHGPHRRGTRRALACVGAFTL